MLRAPFFVVMLLAPLWANAAAGTAVQRAPASAPGIEAPPERATAPWRVSPEMHEWLDGAINHVGTEDQRMMRLLRALERAGFTYDDQITRTGEGVFDTKRFNCLGLAHLVVGLGRAFGVDAYYVRVVERPTYDQRGDLVLAASHIAAGWGPPARIRLVEIGVSPGETSTTRPTHRLGDRGAMALHYANRGAEMLVAGQLELAQAWLHQAARLDPTSASVWVNLGVTERRLGDLERAERSYLQALVLDPGHSSALSNLATLKLLSGNAVDARTMYQALVRAQHRNPFTYLSLGDLHVRNGELSEAHAFYRRARRLDRGEPAIHAALGEWADATGDRKAALRRLARAEAIDADNSRVRRLRERLGR